MARERLPADGPAAGDLPQRTPLGPVADEAFDRIAGLVRQVIGVPVGLVSLVDRDRQVFPGQSGLPEPWNDLRCTPLTHSFCQHVVRTASPLVVRDARLDPVLATNLATVDIGVVGYAGIPLHGLDGVVVGSLCAIDTEPHDWTDSELALLGDLAATCSAELQLRDTARAAGAAQARTSALLDLSETLSNRLTTADISQAVSKLSTEHLGAAFGGITILDQLGQTLTYVDLGALPGAVHATYRSFPLSRSTPSSTVAVTGQSFFFDDIEQLAAAYPEAARALAQTEARSAAYLPLVTPDRIVGTLAILWSRSRTFDADDRALLSGLSSYTAQAVERAQLIADRHEVAQTLQAAMLPSLPHIAWAQLTGRYFPARLTDSVGGDWFDAFELSDHELALSAGDVEGHDTVAAAVMGQLRSTLRGLTISTMGTPSAVLEQLDRVLASLPPARYATGVLATLTRDDRAITFSWSNAGHLAPLLIAPGSAPRFLDRTPAPPLGMPIEPTPRATHTIELPTNSSLLLYTDGLVERRDIRMDDMLRALSDSAARHRDRDLTDMVDAIVADLVDGRHEDDIVLFGLRTQQLHS